jgi:hypothetical protein
MRRRYKDENHPEHMIRTGGRPSKMMGFAVLSFRSGPAIFGGKSTGKEDFSNPLRSLMSTVGG